LKKLTIALLLNPSAGRGKALEKKGQLENYLEKYRIRYDYFESESEEHLRQLSKEATDNYKVIVGAGGDTTFDIIATEIIESGNDNTFAMVGIGSSDDITREFGLTDIKTCCKAIKDQYTKRIDVGHLLADTNHYFLGTASLGLGTTVNKYVKDFQKRHKNLSKSQTLNGILGIFDSFRTGKVPRKITLEYEKKSEEIDFSLLVFNNTSYYASGFIPYPSANPSDGLLNACIIDKDSFLKFLWFRNTQAELIESPSFTVYSQEGIEIQTDGEIRGPYEKMELSVIPRALNIITMV